MLIATVIVISFLVQSMFGFGGALVAIPIISLISDIKLAVPLVMIFQLLMGVLLIFNWKKIEWNNLYPIAPSLFVGVILGVFFLNWLSSSYLNPILGAYICCYVVSELFLQSGGLIKSVSRNAEFAGLTSGLLQGLLGTGGPLMATYLKEVSASVITFRASIIAAAFLLNLVRVMISSPLGLANETVWILAIPILPFFFTAIFVGQKISRYVPRKLFEISILTLLSISGIALFFK